MEKIISVNNKYEIVKIIVGPMSTNCYIISDMYKNAAIVDFAFYDQKILSYFQQKELKLKFVLLTHGHFDHIMGVERGIKVLDEDCDVWIHEFDKELLDDSNKNASCFFDFEVTLRSKNIKTFREGAVFCLNEDIKFTALETPGHTMGSCSFLLNDEFIFTGDALFKGSVGRTDLFSGSREKTQNTVNRFLQMDKDLKVLPGHGYSTSLSEETLNNPVF